MQIQRLMIDEKHIRIIKMYNDEKNIDITPDYMGDSYVSDEEEASSFRDTGGITYIDNKYVYLCAGIVLLIAIYINIFQ